MPLAELLLTPFPLWTRLLLGLLRVLLVLMLEEVSSFPEAPPPLVSLSVPSVRSLEWSFMNTLDNFVDLLLDTDTFLLDLLPPWRK